VEDTPSLVMEVESVEHNYTKTSALSDDEILLNGEPIVMDDIAFEVLANHLDVSVVNDPISVSTVKELVADEESRSVPEVQAKANRKRQRVRKTKTEKGDPKKIKSEPKSQPVQKLICTYCKKMFPSRPDFNDHIAKDHPPQNTQRNPVNEVSSKVIIKKEPSPDILVESQITKSLGKYVKITHIPGDDGTKPKTFEQSDPIALNKSLPKFTKIMFTPVQSSNLPYKMPPGPPGPRGGPPGPPGPSTPLPPGPPGSGSTVAKKLACSLCRSVFLSRPEFQAHMEDVHLINENTSSNQEAIKSKISIAPVTKSFECNMSDNKFDDNGDMKKHKSLEHSRSHKKSHLIKCSKCKARFYGQNQLDEHVKTTHCFKCKKCDFVFDTSNKLNDHNRQDHYFKCSFCDTCFDSKVEIEAHEKEVHQTCEDCEDEFTWTDVDHKCYYTVNKIGPSSDRVQVQNLYFDEYTCYFI